MSENDDVRKDGYYLVLSHDDTGQKVMEQFLSIKGKLFRMEQHVIKGRFKLTEVSQVDEVLCDSYKEL